MQLSYPIRDDHRRPDVHRPAGAGRL